ncbi:MAG TPA: lysozyme inhibitor LprI family protein [Burkholderiaceae bacterium]|nr:lysozyme inhibitor LprI family protein [Burkholderiaceae bacterium]
MNVKCFTALTLFCLSTLATAASLDCRRAQTAVEQLICTDPALSALDDKLNLSYQSAHRRTSAPQELRDGQRTWLREVRNKCATRPCLITAYDQRIRNLAAQPELTTKSTSRCPITEQKLLGPWERVAGDGPFEEMDFSTDGDAREFNSWLHHRLEFAGGTWKLENCVLHIRHATQEQLHYALTVVRVKGNRLYLREEWNTADAVYKRIAP